MKILEHIHYESKLVKYRRKPYNWYLIQTPGYFFKHHQEKWKLKFLPLLSIFPYDEETCWQDIIKGTQLVFVKKKEKIVGYLLVDVFRVKKIDKRILYFHAGSILPEYRRKRLVVRMTHLHLKHLKGNWLGHYFSARTFSPRAYGVTRRMGIVYPSPNSNEIPLDIKYLGMLLARDYFQALDKFDLKTFIFRGIYEKTYKFFENGRLNVALDKDVNINRWLLQRINHRNGDAQLFIGRLAKRNMLHMKYFQIMPF